MKSSHSLSQDEAARLAALQRYAILDTPPERAFDDLTRLAAEICGVPIAVVSLVDEERLWWKSQIGLASTEAPRNDGFCSHAILETEPLVVPDALADPRFADIPVVRANTKIRFYAGVPLVTKDHHVIGAFCVADYRPRDLSPGQRAALETLARQAMAQIEIQDTNRELEEQRRFNAAVVDSTGALVVVSDAEGRIQRFNRTAERLLGYSAAEVIGLCFWEVFVRRTDRERNKRLLDWFAAGRGALDTETEWITRNGEPRRIAWSLTPLAGQAGAAHRIVATGTDVTEQRRAEAWLRQSQERLTFAMEGANDGVWDWNIVTGDVYFSPRWCRMLGYEPEEVASTLEAWTVLVHPEDLAGRLDRVQRHLADETPFHQSEHRVRSKSGAWLWVLDRGKVVERDALGNALRMTGTYTDITERKRAELALRESQETLQAFYDNATMMMGVVSMLDDDLRFISSNTATAAFFRQAPDMLQGRLASTVGMGRAYIDLWLGHLRQSLEAGQPVEFEYLAAHAGGERWISAVVASLGHGPDGYPRFSYLAEDVTERKAAQEALLRAKNDAEAAARAKSEFLAMMSHEIRTPMNGVLGMTGLLLDTRLTSEQREYADTVRSSAKNLLDIINDILDFSKIEAGKLTFDRTPFALRPTIEDAFDLLAEAAQQKGLELAIVADPRVPRVVVGDPGRLRQVLLNLLSNAVKFTEHGQVVLTVALEEMSETDALIRFEVEDTGIGLSEEAQERLFQPFSQADGSTTRRYGGTGLGLAISRQLVHCMNGDIGVTSGEGQGSTFWFTIRLPVSSEAGPADAPILSDARVLCVDDNDAAFAHLDALVMELGGTMDRASTETEAVQRLHAAAAAGRPYVAVLVDAVMPGPGHLPLVQALAGELGHAGAPMIALTSWVQRDRTRVLQTAGIEAMVVKPVHYAHLREAIQRVLAIGDGRSPRTASGTPAVMESHEPVRRLRVLVVEDNKVNQQVAVRVLAKLGHRADVAANGLEAVAAVQRIAYDAVLMDCHMPELDGFEATIRIRRAEAGGPRVPIVAMTASVMQADRDRCFASGMDDFVTKPLELERLRQVLDRWGTHVVAVEPVDPQVLEELRSLDDGDEAGLLGELIDLFLADLPARRAAIRDGLLAGDMQAVRAAAHSLKGSAGNLGARPLAALCQEVEVAIRQGSLEGVAAFVARIDAEAERVAEYLQTVAR